jgi:hypothetical protein
MNSDNPIGADNQQGRPHGTLTSDYIAGFVDGEGCFSVSIRPHPTVRYGTRFVIGPVFQIYQHRDNLDLLEKLKGFFGCGHITSKGPGSSVMTYAVSGRQDLETVIIPFFERYPLNSTKHEDFLKFREIVRSMQLKEHQSDDGFRRIVETAFSMNQRGKQRRYKIEEVLSGTLRDCTPSASANAGDETVRSLWRHGEGDRNDHPAVQLPLDGGNSNA